MTLITPKEFAAIVKVTERTVNNWVREKRLPVLQVGNITRIDYDMFVSMHRLYAPQKLGSPPQANAIAAAA